MRLLSMMPRSAVLKHCVLEQPAGLRGAAALRFDRVRVLGDLPELTQ